MTLTLTCTRCQQDITGADEDDLVTHVQDHVAGHGGDLGRDHGHSHQISRDQVLRRLRRQQSKEKPPA